MTTARCIAGLVIASLAVLSACGAPAYMRGAHIPEDAKLVNWPKIGWGWELCIDAASGSALFSWEAEHVGDPFIRVRLTTCASGSDPRDVLRVEGSASVDFLFPEAPGDVVELADGACPNQLSPEALVRIGNVLDAAIASGRLTPGAATVAERMLAVITRVNPASLRLAGSMGNNNGWSVRCRPEA